MREVMAGAGAHEGHVGCMWDGGSTLRRSRVHQNMSGCIKGGCSACVRSWLGLGHMKGVWDVAGMVVVCQKVVGCVETRRNASKGAAAHA